MFQCNIRFFDLFLENGQFSSSVLVMRCTELYFSRKRTKKVSITKCFLLLISLQCMFLFSFFLYCKSFVLVKYTVFVHIVVLFRLMDHNLKLQNKMDGWTVAYENCQKNEYFCKIQWTDEYFQKIQICCKGDTARSSVCWSRKDGLFLCSCSRYCNKFNFSKTMRARVELTLVFNGSELL